jgi:predicted nucleic-acid-binding Zn-ribbon protein
MLLAWKIAVASWLASPHPFLPLSKCKSNHFFSEYFTFPYYLISKLITVEITKFYHVSLSS